MPNWCDCDLTIFASGKTKVEQLRAFVHCARQGEGKNADPLSFDQFISYPARFKKMDHITEEMQTFWNKLMKAAGVDFQKDKAEYTTWVEKFPPPNLPNGFNSGGYDWCCSNWGTKWGACDATLSVEKIEKGRILYNFQTAWSPALPVIIAMSTKFPRLKFTLRYYEAGMGYCGVFRVKAGAVLADRSGSYSGGRGG